MKLRRVLAIARKEFLHIVRDPRSLGMAIAIPMIMLLLFGYALTVDVDNVPVLVWDQSGTAASRELVSRFDGSPYFTLQGYADGYEEIVAGIDARRTLVGLVIPADYARQIERAEPAPVQLIVDGTDSNTATIAIGYAEAIAAAHGQQLAIEELRQLGGPRPQPPLEVRPRVWFNSDLESRNYIIPGLIAVIMMVIAALLTSLTVAREWERGTMEQLISTPVKGRELIVGKLIPYFVIGMFDVLVAVLVGEFLFHVPLRGNPALIFALGAIFLVGALSMGLLISIVAKNQLLASQMAMVTTFLPAFLLSGFMIPIANMPVVVRGITYIVPARYFVRLLHGIYLKGVGMGTLAFEAALLVVYAGVMVLLAHAKFRKKL